MKNKDCKNGTNKKLMFQKDQSGLVVRIENHGSIGENIAGKNLGKIKKTPSYLS